MTSTSRFSTPEIAQSSEALTIRWQDSIHLTFALRSGPGHTEFLGLAAAQIEGIDVIAEGSIRRPHLETRNGWTVKSLHFLQVKELENGSIAIECEVWAIKPPVGRRIDMFGFPYITAPQDLPENIGIVSWQIHPEHRELGYAAVRQTPCTGISYAFDFQLTQPFHWLLDTGTWEIGGDAEGVTIFSQHMAAIGGPMEFQITKDGDPYTSAETFPKGASNNADVFTDTANDPNERYVIPIQAQLRGAGGAMIDFQYKGDKALLCFYEKIGYYRTLVEYSPQHQGIGHMDAIYFPKTLSFVSPLKTVLVATLPKADRIAALNLWTDTHEFVGDAWRGEKNFTKVQPVPGCGIDTTGAAGTHLGYGPADMLVRWEERLDWMKEHGFQTFFIHGSIGDHRGFEFPMVANNCQPYDYRPHAFYGGAEAFRRLCDAARERGIGVYVWLGMPCPSAPLYKENAHWKIRYDNGAAWDGNYVTINSASIKRGFGEWLMDELTNLKELGLSGVWIDSYHNLWAMPVDYGQPDLRPQFEDLLDLQCRIADIGLKCWTESFTPIGLTTAGLWPQYLASPELAYWTHFHALANKQVPGRPNVFRNGQVTLEVYWRMMANKAPIGVWVMEIANMPFEGLPDIPEEIGVMNHVYNQLSSTMQVRTLYPDGSIAWYNPENGERSLFGTGSGVTVPDGFRAVPVYGTEETFTSGSFPLSSLAAFQLSPI